MPTRNVLIPATVALMSLRAERRTRADARAQRQPDGNGRVSQ